MPSAQFTYTLPQVRTASLADVRPMLVFSLILTAVTAVPILVREFAVVPLLAAGTIPLCFGTICLWMLLRVRTAARMSADISIGVGNNPGLSIEWITPRRRKLDLPPESIFCTYVGHVNRGDACLRIQLNDGTSHDLFVRRSLFELRELSDLLNLHLKIPPQAQRIAAWYAGQQDAPLPSLDMSSRAISVQASSNELLIRIPPRRVLDTQTLFMLLIGLAPYLMIAAIVLGASVYVAARGTSPIAFWERVGPDFVSMLWPHQWKFLLWAALWCGSIPFAPRPWTTVTVSPGRLTYSRQQGKRITTRDLDSSLVEDVGIGDQWIYIHPSKGMPICFRIPGTPQQREHLRDLLLEAVGLRSPARPTQQTCMSLPSVVADATGDSA